MGKLCQHPSNRGQERRTVLILSSTMILISLETVQLGFYNTGHAASNTNSWTHFVEGERLFYNNQCHVHAT
jgi:hypothetical protein